MAPKANPELFPLTEKKYLLTIFDLSKIYEQRRSFFLVLLCFPKQLSHVYANLNLFLSMCVEDELKEMVNLITEHVEMDLALPEEMPLVVNVFRGLIIWRQFLKQLREKLFYSLVNEHSAVFFENQLRDQNGNLIRPIDSYYESLLGVEILNEETPRIMVETLHRPIILQASLIPRTEPLTNVTPISQETHVPRVQGFLERGTDDIQQQPDAVQQQNETQTQQQDLQEGDAAQQQEDDIQQPNQTLILNQNQILNILYPNYRYFNPQEETLEDVKLKNPKTIDRNCRNAIEKALELMQKYNQQTNLETLNEIWMNFEKALFLKQAYNSLPGYERKKITPNKFVEVASFLETHQ